jgi:hypothetical protein
VYVKNSEISKAMILTLVVPYMHYFELLRTATPLRCDEFRFSIKQNKVMKGNRRKKIAQKVIEKKTERDTTANYMLQASCSLLLSSLLD